MDVTTVGDARNAFPSQSLLAVMVINTLTVAGLFAAVVALERALSNNARELSGHAVGASQEREIERVEAVVRTAYL
jgi:hypothetical protein